MPHADNLPPSTSRRSAHFGARSYQSEAILRLVRETRSEHTLVRKLRSDGDRARRSTRRSCGQNARDIATHGARRRRRRRATWTIRFTISRGDVSPLRQPRYDRVAGRCRTPRCTVHGSFLARNLYLRAERESEPSMSRPNLDGPKCTERERNGNRVLLKRVTSSAVDALEPMKIQTCACIERHRTSSFAFDTPQRSLVDIVSD